MDSPRKRYVHDDMNVFFFLKKYSDVRFIRFEEHVNKKRNNESIVKLGNFQRGGYCEGINRFNVYFIY